jgi:hypothetical protein
MLANESESLFRLPGDGARRSRVVNEELFSQAYAGFWGETVLPVERDGTETGCSIEREGGCLPHAGFQDDSPNAQCPGLRLEGGKEAPPQTCSADSGSHIHPFEFGRLRVEEPEGAAADGSPLPVNDEEGAAPGGYFLGIQPKVSGSWLGIETMQLVVQGANEGAADLCGQVGAGDGDCFR